MFASIVIAASVALVEQMPASADNSDVPAAETRCVQGSDDPHASPAKVYKDCQAAAKLFRSMFSQASPADQGLITTNLALFEFYEAHALDGLKGPGSGDELRANAKTLFSTVSQHDPDVKVRSHAKDALKCFYGGDQKACERAFSASSTSY